MGFVTGIYNEATPRLNSGTFFRSLEYIDLINGITYKYRITLNDNTEWLLYATPLASLGTPPFELIDSATIEGPEGFVGMIQVAKNPAKESGEAIYDSAAGAFPTGATLSGSIEGSAGRYSLSWSKDGVANQTLLMFALPHHVESFDETTRAALTDIELMTTTKGMAKAVKADAITMVESNLPDSIGFMPWVPSSSGNGGTTIGNLDTNILAALNRVGALELGEDFDKQTRLDSMYYSGKGLAKFATVIVTLQELGKNSELAAAGLVKLKEAFKVFIDNKQPLPLVYDTVWKGVVSSGTYEKGDPGLDFGNTLYNDHHFHYGYFVYTAAVIGYLDPAWMDEGTNRVWTNMLVRDFANPSTNDPSFPHYRSFDWFHGHSWAKGLFESGDGKDQESTSEDTFSAFALKMWGRVSGDANMEARGNLQLAVQARSLRNYFLLDSGNKVQPERFLPNKVTGILFENKVDHTTYFGANDEYVQGIHMLPLNPSSAYTRSRQFVQEEWDTYFSNGRADAVEGGWKGVLFGNLAAVDPVGAFEFFNNPDFDHSHLDGGASLTWYLAYSAAMGTQGPVEAATEGGEWEAAVLEEGAGEEEGTEAPETKEWDSTAEEEGFVEEEELVAEDGEEFAGAEAIPEDAEFATAEDEDAFYEEEQGGDPSWSDIEERTSETEYDADEWYPESDRSELDWDDEYVTFEEKKKA
jgi:endo-1,3(4)-beta-glucanase